MYPTILTMASRDEPVQERCIRSMLDVGFEDIHVFAEPNTEIPTSLNGCVRLTIWKQRLGLFNNWVQAVKEFLWRNPSAERIITAQDDVVYSRNVGALVSQESWPSERCGLLTIYTSKRYACYPVGKRSRLSDVHERKFGGACCMLFSRKCLEEVVASLQDRPWRGAIDRTVTGVDMVGLDIFLGERLYSLGYEIWVRVPSLAQTIAKGSTVGHGGPHGPRSAALWCGEMADALQIFREEIGNVGRRVAL